mmetsp:Transcript_45064/g.101772  ORF Transcript_45064/g.101772 Transcript_45064/m.101772 type:complete len:253 (-) Transcript_45064:70-828(-)
MASRSATLTAEATVAAAIASADVSATRVAACLFAAFTPACKTTLANTRPTTIDATASAAIVCNSWPCSLLSAQTSCSTSLAKCIPRIDGSSPRASRSSWCTSRAFDSASWCRVSSRSRTHAANCIVMSSRACLADCSKAVSSDTAALYLMCDSLRSASSAVLAAARSAATFSRSSFSSVSNSASRSPAASRSASSSAATVSTCSTSFALVSFHSRCVCSQRLRSCSHTSCSFWWSSIAASWSTRSASTSALC